MKRIVTKLVLLMVLAMTSFHGCTPDDTDIQPADPRDKFLGEWKVDEDCSRGNYVAKITADAGNSTRILIENFGNPGPGYDAAVGTVVSNSIQVSVQNIGEGWTVSGQGTYNSNGSISWSYTLVISGYTENCSALFTP